MKVSNILKLMVSFSVHVYLAYIISIGARAAISIEGYVFICTALGVVVCISGFLDDLDSALGDEYREVES